MMNKLRQWAIRKLGGEIPAPPDSELRSIVAYGPVKPETFGCTFYCRDGKALSYREKRELAHTFAEVILEHDLIDYEYQSSDEYGVSGCATIRVYRPRNEEVSDG